MLIPVCGLLTVTVAACDTLQASTGLVPIAVPTSFATLPSYLTDLMASVPENKQVVDLDNFGINTVKFPGFDAPPAERCVRGFV